MDSFAVEGVRKKVLYAGKGAVPEFGKDDKVTFHFQTRILKEGDEQGTLLDDSHKYNRPMELIIGKQFRMPVWEKCLRSMRIGEVASFDVNKSLVTAYPLVSRSYRQFAGLEDSQQRRYCCGGIASSQAEFWKQDDANVLLQKPQDLQFTIELLKVETAGEYVKETWCMTPEEKLSSVPRLREEGNKLYNDKKFKEAAQIYAEALNRLEQLILREMPGDESWKELEKMKAPLLLNYSQCKLLEKDYYAVIQHTTEVLEHEPGNVKALYKRAKAYAGVWDLQSAEKDYRNILDLDPSMKGLISKELNNLNLLKKKQEAEEREKYHGKSFWSTSDS